MGKLTEQLKKHIDEVGKEAFAQECFEFNCRWHGIDPNDPKAKKKLKRAERRTWFRYVVTPQITKVLNFVCAFIWAFLLGAWIERGNVTWCIISSLFSICSGATLWFKYMKGYGE